LKKVFPRPISLFPQEEHILSAAMRTRLLSSYLNERLAAMNTIKTVWNARGNAERRFSAEWPLKG